MPKDSIYLSGWEYNRLLEEDPTEPRPSMLPGSALWNGGAQFWLFQNVYCTKESLDAEIRASEAVGFITGKIWQELHKREFLKTFDWKELIKEAPERYNSLIEIHRDLREKYNKQGHCSADSEIAIDRADDRFYTTGPNLLLLRGAHHVRTG